MKRTIFISAYIIIIISSCMKLSGYSDTDIILSEYESKENEICIEVIIKNINPTYSYGLCWDTILNPQINDNFLQLSEKNGTSVYCLNKLQTNKKYFIRVCRLNSDNQSVSYYNQITVSTKQRLRWFKGNTHAHSKYSDGSLSVNDVINEYKKLNYCFLYITDHNIIVPTRDLSDNNMLVLPGVEDTFSKHVVGLNLNNFYVSSSLPASTSMILNYGGVPILAHPFWPPTRTTYKDIISQTNLHHIEIFNGITESWGHKDNNSLWDSLLTSGKIIYGIASDDSHTLKDIGKGWIVVQSESLHKDSIFMSIKNGNFYSSTGIEIENIRKNKDSIYIKTKNATEIKFIGKNGQLLLSVNANFASFNISSIDAYVRVEALNNKGEKAWTQPLVWKNK